MAFKADYKDIDPRYGTLEDVDHLIAELKKRDMKLVMDLVSHAVFDRGESLTCLRSSIIHLRRYVNARNGLNMGNIHPATVLTVNTASTPGSSSQNHPLTTQNETGTSGRSREGSTRTANPSRRTTGL